jgi:hypothetical protein
MLRLAASLIDQAPVSLGKAITGIDDRNVGLLVKAILQTTPVPSIAQEALALVRLHTGPSSPVGSTRSARGVTLVTVRNYSVTYTETGSGEALHPRSLLCRMSTCGWPGVRPGLHLGECL